MTGNWPFILVWAHARRHTNCYCGMIIANIRTWPWEIVKWKPIQFFFLAKWWYILNRRKKNAGNRNGSISREDGLVVMHCTNHAFIYDDGTCIIWMNHGRILMSMLASQGLFTTSKQMHTHLYSLKFAFISCSFAMEQKIHDIKVTKVHTKFAFEITIVMAATTTTTAKNN